MSRLGWPRLLVAALWIVTWAMGLTIAVQAERPTRPGLDRLAGGSSGEALRWSGETGFASYYGRAQTSSLTASGAPFDEDAMTAAHPWLPFGTQVRVTVASTGKSVIVTINDRLPASRRIVDLSVAAARHLGLLQRGIATVSLSPA